MIILLALVWLTLAQTCGNGKKESPEGCDDVNTLSGDGCSATCTLETGYMCSGGTVTQRDYCGPNVGDNILVTGVEECDDGNAVSGDGCSDRGTVEFSHLCFPNPDSGSLYVCTFID